MKQIIAALLLGLFALPAFADPQCTTEPKSKWKDRKAFEQSLREQGYKIKKFKITRSNCYEIDGWDKEGNKVEIYYNPVNGEVIEQEIEYK